MPVLPREECLFQQRLLSASSLRCAESFFSWKALQSLGMSLDSLLAACRRLSLADRATMVPLLAAVVDFDSSPETYARYDSMTALELFQK